MNSFKLFSFLKKYTLIISTLTATSTFLLAFHAYLNNYLKFILKQIDNLSSYIALDKMVLITLTISLISLFINLICFIQGRKKYYKYYNLLWNSESDPVCKLDGAILEVPHNQTDVAICRRCNKIDYCFEIHPNKITRLNKNIYETAELVKELIANRKLKPYKELSIKA